jgi:heme A synthase
LNFIQVNLTKKIMLHLIGVFVLLFTAGIALTQKEEKRFPVVMTGAVIAWVLVITQLTLHYI